MMENTRGGKRPGAGRPKNTGKYGEPTKCVRIPVSMVEEIQNILDYEIAMRQLSQENDTLDKRTEWLKNISGINSNYLGLKK